MKGIAMDGFNSLVLGYIDPGTGALVLQMLFAALVTVSLFGKRLLAAPLSLFRKPKREDAAANSTDTTESKKRAA
jgi:hypothetical protein